MTGRSVLPGAPPEQAEQSAATSLRCQCGGMLQAGVAPTFDFSPLAGVPAVLKEAPCLRCQLCGARTLRGEFIEAVFADLTRALLQNLGPLHSVTFKYLRKELRLGPQELAQKLEVSSSVVRDWECGRTPIPQEAAQRLRAFVGDVLAAPPTTRASGAHLIVRLEAPLPCTRCQTHSVHLCMRPGRTMRYRNLQGLVIPDNLLIPACTRCGAMVLDAEMRARLAPFLEDAYRRELRQRIRYAIDTLVQHTSQRRLEQLIGLSDGYLSRLRAGLRNPSPELVSHLALLARMPKKHLPELERYWATRTAELAKDFMSEDEQENRSVRPLRDSP